MADEIQPDTAAEAVCTWCSAPLSSPDLERCPSCGANLVGDVAEPLPGVTAVDAAALVRGLPSSSRPRNRLLSWISGDYPDDVPTATDAKALEPPDIAVRREILRLELEGEVANLKAEADALVAEAAAEGRSVVYRRTSRGYDETPIDIVRRAREQVAIKQGLEPGDRLALTRPEEHAKRGNK